jgi:pimeloyl-ACP methyl ester carboxylesterase
MWRFVVDTLGDLGARIVLADLPTVNRPDASFTDDVEHVRDLVSGGPVVLCGHSYGGAVITQAGVGMPALAHLVYVAAFAPAVGETVFDLMTKRTTDAGLPLEFFDDGTTLPQAWAADDGIYDAESLSRMRQFALRRQASASAIEPLSGAAWRDTPSTYVLATRDSVLHPKTQREMAERAGARIVELAGHHMVNFENPGELGQVLRSVVASLR